MVKVLRCSFPPLRGLTRSHRMHRSSRLASRSELHSDLVHAAADGHGRREVEVCNKCAEERAVLDK